MMGTPKATLFRLISLSFPLLFLINLLFIGHLVLAIIGKEYSFVSTVILSILVILILLCITAITIMEMIELKVDNKKETDFSGYKKESKVSCVLFNSILIILSIILSTLVFIYAKTIPTLLLDVSWLLIIYNTLFQLLLLPVEIREIKGKLYGID